MTKKFSFLFILIPLSFTGCSTTLNNLPGVYSLGIQQGNIITQDMINQLRPNMTKRQILYIMGSSMLVDVFHQNRWDYLYSEQPGGEARMQKRISLYFNDDKLIGVQGDFRPSSLPVIIQSKEQTVDLPTRELEKTMLEKITGLFDDEVEVVAATEVEPIEETTEQHEESSSWWDIFDL